MDYSGRYTAFDPSRISTYPLSDRTNKVKITDLVMPDHLDNLDLTLPQETLATIQTLATAIVEHRSAGKPVVLFTGAHLIKNGLGPLLIDLINRDVFTLIAGNGATTIHDFELALIGQTSEHVPNALETGGFGMAYEFALINTALTIGDRHNLGYGESLGKTICDDHFRADVFTVARDDSPKEFAHPEISVLAACYTKGIPFTVHVGIGTDVIDQHPSFDGRAKGGCSGRDFLIYTDQIANFTTGGIALNIASAVTGPEVLLKAVSMAANVGRTPHKIITADFDIRRHEPAQMSDESTQCYYFRDQKSVVTRIPQAFHGTGSYIQANQRTSLPVLYREIIRRL